jgi:hypothetical protein
MDVGSLEMGVIIGSMKALIYIEVILPSLLFSIHHISPVGHHVMRRALFQAKKVMIVNPFGLGCRLVLLGHLLLRRGLLRRH